MRIGAAALVAALATMGPLGAAAGPAPVVPPAPTTAPQAPPPVSGAPSGSGASPATSASAPGYPSPPSGSPAPPGQPSTGYPPGYGPAPNGYGPAPNGYGPAPNGYGPAPFGYPPSPDGYPPGPPVAPGQQPPETLPYEEGDPIPAGYHVEDEGITGLVVTGAIVAPTVWLLTGVIGTVATFISGGVAHPTEGGAEYELLLLWIPLAGPFVTIGAADVEGAVLAPLIASGVLQCAGLAMLIAGAAVRHDVLVWDGGSAQLTVGPAGSEFQGANIGLVGTF